MINKQTNQNALFSCEGVAKFDDKYYYSVRGYNSMDNHNATFGWYFVNSENGEVYDAGPTIGELIIIPKR